MSHTDFSENNKDKFNPEQPQKVHTGLWIPAAIEESGLSPLEIMLWAYIHSYDGEHGCYASNAHFSKRLNTSERNVQLMIKALKERGFVYQESFDGRIRILRCSLKQFQKSLVKNKLDTYEKFCTSGVKNSSPLQRSTVHPYIKEERKEDIKKTKAKKDGDRPPDKPKAASEDALADRAAHDFILAFEKVVNEKRKEKGWVETKKSRTKIMRGHAKSILKRFGEKRCMEVIKAVAADDFWLPKLTSVAYLNKNFEKLDPLRTQTSNKPLSQQQENARLAQKAAANPRAEQLGYGLEIHNGYFFIYKKGKGHLPHMLLENISLEDKEFCWTLENKLRKYKII